MTKLTRSQIWTQVKAIGNPTQLKWQSSTQQWLDALQNHEDQLNMARIQQRQNIAEESIEENVPEFQLIISAERFRSKIQVNYYQDKNRNQDYSNKTILESYLKLMGDSKQVMVRIKDRNGDGQWKTLTRDQLLQFADDDFVFHQSIVGSDGSGENDVLDFKTGFGVVSVAQLGDVEGFCNDRECIKQLKEVVVFNPRTRSMNCFDQCLKYLGYKLKKIGNAVSGVTIKNAKQYISENNLPLSIALDQVDENGNLEYSFKNVNEQQTLIFTVCHDTGLGHWSIFKHINHKITDDNKSQQIEKAKTEKSIVTEILYCYFDYETIFNKELTAEPYSLSWFLTTKPIDINEDNLQQYVDNTKFVTINDGDNLTSQMFNDIAKIKNIKKVQLISYNGSNFDNYLLLDDISAQDFTINATFSGKSIVGVKFNKFRCWDLAKFLTGSLDSNCKNFNICPKKISGFEHKQFQDAYNENRLNEFIASNYTDLEKYNKYDVLALASLSQKFRDSMITILEKDQGNKAPSDPIQYDTIGQQSYTRFKQSIKEKNVGSPVVLEKHDKFIRKCLNAGRTEVMQSVDKKPVHLTGKKLSMVDVVSLYPSVMMDSNAKYPVGDLCQVFRQNSQKLGFYQIVCKQRKDKPNVLPKRNYDDPTQPLDWKCKTEETYYCTSVDIEVLRKAGNYVKVIKGYEFDAYITGDKLFACLNVFKDEKIRQDCYKSINSLSYNVAMREVCKLYLNSLSGKVIQRNYTTQTQIVRNEKEMNKFLSQCKEGTVTLNRLQKNYVVLNGESLQSYNPLRAKPSQLGVYIYAHARKLMYNNIFSEITGEYTDTDSCLCYYDQELKLRQNRPELFRKEEIVIDGQTYSIKPFGTLDCEINPEDNINEAILLQPKNYLVMNRETNNLKKVKCKGVSFTNNFCTYDDGKTLQSDPIRFFDSLLANKNIQVSCGQMTISNFRNSHTSKFGIKYRTVNKTIKLQ